MTDRVLMQLALYALEEITGWQSLAPGYVMEEADEAKNFLRERLARPEQEPVAWRYKINPPHWTYSAKYPNKELAGDAWYSWQVTPLYTASPEREWVGLTQQEINSIVDSNMTITDHLLRDAIEAIVVDIEVAIMEKNHG